MTCFLLSSGMFGMLMNVFFCMFGESESVASGNFTIAAAVTIENAHVYL